MDDTKAVVEREKPPASGGRARKKLSGLKVAKYKQYDVVKKHHLHGWLRQVRILEITSTHVCNCKPPEVAGANPKVTKQFPLTHITSIGLKGKNAFCLHVDGDHVYYYYSPQAIEIAYDIQHYVSAANAVEMLLEPGDRSRARLMDQLITGAIPLPGVQSIKAMPFAAHSPRVMRLQSNITVALRSGTVKGSDELRELTRQWQEKAAGDAMDLAQLRSSMNTIRDLCAVDVLQRSARPHHDEMELYTIILTCVERVLQHVVIRSNFDKIIETLRKDKSLAERQEHFDQQRRTLRGNSAELFDVPKGLRGIRYKLVLHHFDNLSTCKCPSDIIDQILNIAACLCLTVHVATRMHRGTKPHAKKKNNHGAAQVTISTKRGVSSSGCVAARGVDTTSITDHPIGSTNEKTHTESEPISIVKSALDKSLYRVVAAYMGEGSPTPSDPADAVGDNCASAAPSLSPLSGVSPTPILPSINKDENENAASNADTAVAAGAVAEEHLNDSPVPLSSSVGPSIEVSGAQPLKKAHELWFRGIDKESNNSDDDKEVEEENLSISNIGSLSFAPSVASSSSLKRYALSGDEIIPLFIHLLCQSSVPDVCFALHAVNLLHDTSGSSEADYYLTTFSAAVEMICQSDPPPP